MLLASCEETNVLMMTEATSEAVTAITLSDDEVRNLAKRVALDSGSKHAISPTGNPYVEQFQ